MALKMPHLQNGEAVNSKITPITTEFQPHMFQVIYGFQEGWAVRR
jgi:hypothetical protein